MEVEFILKGGSPLLCHNPRMVDPDNEYTREIKKLTAKKKKTDEDFKEIERLEWRGGLYTGTCGGREVVTQPASKVRKCLIMAARISKRGKDIERAIVMTDLDVPLIYDGSERAGNLKDEIERLISNPAFHSRLSVGIGKKRVMRVRPQFHPWALLVRAMFVTDAGMNFDELAAVFDLAGRSERIGDNRVNGYGAFQGYVREVTRTTRPIEPTIAGVSKWIESLERREAA